MFSGRNTWKMHEIYVFVVNHVDKLNISNYWQLTEFKKFLLEDVGNPSLLAFPQYIICCCNKWLCGMYEISTQFTLLWCSETEMWCFDQKSIKRNDLSQKIALQLSCWWHICQCRILQLYLKMLRVKDIWLNCWWHRKKE